MTFRFLVKTITAITFAFSISTTSFAATCGNTSSGFNTWKNDFARDAKRAGVGKRGLAALAGATYATRTIKADRNQHSFKFTLAKFLKVRGADTIVSQGRRRIAKNPSFYKSLEKRFGVPAG